MQDLEEDPELRTNVNIYRDPNKVAVDDSEVETLSVDDANEEHYAIITGCEGAEKVLEMLRARAGDDNLALLRKVLDGELPGLETADITRLWAGLLAHPLFTNQRELPKTRNTGLGKIMTFTQKTLMK